MILLVCTEGEQMEECDDTASPNDESQYETGDSNVDRNYSTSDDSHSDTSDSNISSLHEVSVSALNEPQNLDLTAERENRNRRERNTAIQSEWKTYITKIST